MGILLIRPKSHLPAEKIAELNKGIRRLGRHFLKCQEDGVPPVVTFDPAEVDVFGSLATIGSIEPEMVIVERGGQPVQLLELKINLADFV